MEKNTQPTYITVYRNGKLDRFETYKPIIHDFLVKVGLKIDYFFVNGRWPRGEQAGLRAQNRPIPAP